MPRKEIILIISHFQSISFMFVIFHVMIFLNDIWIFNEHCIKLFLRPWWSVNRWTIMTIWWFSRENGKFSILMRIGFSTHIYLRQRFSTHVYLRPQITKSIHFNVTSDVVPFFFFCSHFGCWRQGRRRWSMHGERRLLHRRDTGRFKCPAHEAVVLTPWFIIL